ncbi:hypothetical protein [Polyangium sp. y55x31]|uniref:hypothetical protein n=1 Tax=Polyangium sp. y55x31 TaxID=3042688 RepID=UPI0024830D70|nr:hypothetical protein [Polyangium sp. y55x31]MDI1481010.1 hypothetical protein [Polyangium sp. y55x31]
MNKYEGEYRGAALQSLLLALGHSEALVEKILKSCGVDRIDPERWYDLHWGCNVVYGEVAARIGPSAILAVGKKMIEAAVFPPGLDDVRSMLSGLDAAYRLNARGPSIGGITCTFDEDRSATLDWTAPGPCALNIGIIQGCCSRVGARPLVEHGATGCMEHGAPSCIYRVSW